MTALLLALAAVLGLVVGSFLNVVVHRVPRGMSVVRPRSACPTCGAPVRARDNVPVVSWLLLRARCRDCAAPISWRYPLVEAGTALAFVGVVARLALTDDLWWALPAYFYLAAIGVALALIDIDVHRLPNAIVLPSYPVLALLLGGASLALGDAGSAVRALVGGAALWVLYFALMLAKSGGMGYGDVKLAGLLGAALGWLGWGTLAVGAFAAFLVGGIYAIALLVARRAGRATRIPFGPWMVTGAAVGFAVGEPAWRAYLGVFAGG